MISFTICLSITTCVIRYLRRDHTLDVTEIFRNLEREKNKRLVKVGYVVVLLCFSLFWYFVIITFCYKIEDIDIFKTVNTLSPCFFPQVALVGNGGSSIVEKHQTCSSSWSLLGMKFIWFYTPIPFTCIHPLRLLFLNLMQPLAKYIIFYFTLLIKV